MRGRASMRSPAPARPDDLARFAVSPVRARIHLAWSSWTDRSTTGVARLLDDLLTATGAPRQRSSASADGGDRRQGELAGDRRDSTSPMAARCSACPPTSTAGACAGVDRVDDECRCDRCVQASHADDGRARGRVRASSVRRDPSSAVAADDRRDGDDLLAARREQFVDTSEVADRGDRDERVRRSDHDRHPPLRSTGERRG